MPSLQVLELLAQLLESLLFLVEEKDGYVSAMPQIQLGLDGTDLLVQIGLICSATAELAAVVTELLFSRCGRRWAVSLYGVIAGPLNVGTTRRRLATELPDGLAVTAAP
jgi:hypothetical protein